MRVHNVIITTTGAGEKCEDGSVDRMIQRVLDLGKNPILVLGPEGDAVLLNSRLAEACDLVFDPNYEGHSFSSIKAGLHATVGPAFVLPLLEVANSDSAWESTDTWKRLESELDSPESQASDVVRLVTHKAVPSQSIYPLVITPKGVKSLLNLEAQTDWTAQDLVTARFVSLD